jgi:hypothetical protein
MKANVNPRVPSTIMSVLQETANRLGGLQIDIIITAAVWAFCRQDVSTRRSLVADFWLR